MCHWGRDSTRREGGGGARATTGKKHARGENHGKDPNDNNPPQGLYH
jgi:hypothetical protein